MSEKNPESIIRLQISTLEKEYAQIKGKLGTPDLSAIQQIEFIMEAEKIFAAIRHLYICVGALTLKTAARDSIRSQLSSLEKDRQRIKRKLEDPNLSGNKRIESIIEMEKISVAIAQLHICNDKISSLDP